MRRKAEEGAGRSGAEAGGTPAQAGERASERSASAPFLPSAGPSGSPQDTEASVDGVESWAAAEIEAGDRARPTAGPDRPVPSSPRLARPGGSSPPPASSLLLRSVRDGGGS